MAIKGKGVLIKVNTGTNENPVYTTVAGQKGATLNQSRETLEATTKDNDYKEFLAGYGEWSIEAEGLLQLEDEGFSKLEEAFNSGELVQVQFAMPSGDIYEGMAVITDLPIEAPYDDLVSYSCTLQGSGQLVKKEN